VSQAKDVEVGAIAPPRPDREAATGYHVHLKELRQRVQVEAASWGILTSINSTFVSPLLVSRGAGALALGIYNSLANLLGYSAGFAGPHIAQRKQSVSKTALICMGAGRFVFLALPLAMVAISGGGVPLLMSLILLWTLGEGLALPLWTSFIAGMVGTEDRGKWLAMRATAATGASAGVMVAIFILLRLASKESVLPLAYSFAALGGVVSWFQLRTLFKVSKEPPIPPAKKIKDLPASPVARRFLASVVFFWFGAGLIWPVLPPYIIHELHAPTSYFAGVAVVASISSAIVQRRWGRMADRKGASRVLFIAGLGTAIVPFLWALTPVYWLGFGIEVIASSSWPGHMLGLTMKSVELAESEAERPQMLAWTNLAQGSGACISPIVASILVGYTGTVPLLIAATCFRLAASWLLGGVDIDKLRTRREF
jgi:MFS family permease